MKKRELRELVNNSSAGYGNEENEEEFNIPVAKVSNVNSEGFFHRDFEIRSFSEKDKNKLLAKNNDLFVVKSSGSKSNILSGKTALYNKTVFPVLVASNFLFRLSPDEKEIDPKYLWYFLNSQHSKNYIKTIVGATTYPNLKWNLYGKLPVPVTSLDQQKKIAAILDAADEYRQKTKALIAKYDELTQSLFLDMFGDTWLNPKGWQVLKIEDLAIKEKHGIKAGPFGSSLKKEFYVKSGYKIYGQEQVIKDDLEYGDYYIDETKYRELESCKINAGDILISLVGTYGKISVVPEEFEAGIINPRLMKISPDKSIIRPDFLKMLLQSSGVGVQMKNQSRGGTMDIVNVGIMKGINVPLPPLDLQNQFADRVKAIETQKAQAQESLSKAEELFNSLLQRAFKGELV